MDEGFILRRQTEVMTQRSGEVKNWRLRPRVSNRDAFAKAEFQIGNFIAAKCTFQLCACVRLPTRKSLEVIQTKMDSADLYVRRRGLRIPIVSTPTLALGLQSSIHAEVATTEQATVSKTVSG
jgi:hypothetical protein